MLYTSFSLNGSWIMDYTEGNYASRELPKLTNKQATVEDAVPGYWEDMNDKFRKAPFFRFLRVNPEYGIHKVVVKV